MTPEFFIKTTEPYKMPLVTSNRQPRMTPESFVKTTESYEVSLVTSDRQTSYESGILYNTAESYEICRWIIRGLPIGSPSGRYIYRNGPKQVGLITASDQTVQAVHILCFLLHLSINSIVKNSNQKSKLCRSR